MARALVASAPLDVQALWTKYEDIAMHFNDLLMRLRSQSLAGIAAVSTFVGIFTKEGETNFAIGWLAATAIFVAMAFFWVAIFCLDFFYYNRLLTGAVSALTDLEAVIKDGGTSSIDMSINIENEFNRPVKLKSFSGVIAFYMIVLFVIIAGACFSGRMYAHREKAKPSPAAVSSTRPCVVSRHSESIGDPAVEAFFGAGSSRRSGGKLVRY